MNFRKKRKRIELYLHNDNYNSFEYVTLALSRNLPKCNVIRAEQLAILAHNNGMVKICSGFSPEIYAVQANLVRIGLKVESKKA